VDVRVLIVDDEADIRLVLKLAVQAHDRGLVVAGEAADGWEALEALDRADPSVIVLDHRMPTISGLETAAKILERRPQQIIILFSGYLDDKLRSDAAALGVKACIPKQNIDRVAPLALELGSAA